MPHALLFDLDGTLSDTHDLSRATWLEVLRPYGIDVDFRFYQDHIRGRSQPDILEVLLPDLAADERQALGARERRRYRDRTRRAAPLPGVSDFMALAREHGFRLALVTNAPRHDAFVSLEPLGLVNVFEPMVFADEVEASKPDPAPYRAALARMGIEAGQAIAFEDSPRGVRSARSAGLTVIALVTTHHPRDLRAAGAALVIGDFTDTALDSVLNDPASLGDGQGCTEH